MTRDIMSANPAHRWFLEDAEEAHVEYGERFNLPSREEREGIQIGDHVKLIFVIPEPTEGEEPPIYQGERIWVTVTKSETLKFAGKLHTTPETECPLCAGAEVQFGPEHVTTVMIRQSDPRHPLYAKTLPGRLWRKFRYALRF